MIHTLRGIAMQSYVAGDPPITMSDDNVEVRSADAGEMTVGFFRLKQGTDLGPALVGLPHDSCPCPHWGYMLEGRLLMRVPGEDQTYEAGQAFYWGPGHAPGRADGLRVRRLLPIRGTGCRRRPSHRRWELSAAATARRAARAPARGNLWSPPNRAETKNRHLRRQGHALRRERCGHPGRFHFAELPFGKGWRRALRVSNLVLPGRAARLTDADARDMLPPVLRRQSDDDAT